MDLSKKVREECENAAAGWKLNPKERAALAQFAQNVCAKELKLSAFNAADNWVRFLIARDWNVEKAWDMFFASTKWRKAEGVDSILNWMTPEVFETRSTAKLLNGTDGAGDCVYLERLGKHDFGGFFETVGVSCYRRFCIYHREHMAKLLNQRYQESGSQLQGRRIVVIVDLDGLSFAQATAYNLRGFRSVTDFDQANYPEVSSKTFIVNAPVAFQLIWKLVKPFFDEGTIKKFAILTGSSKSQFKSQLKELSKDIPMETIPRYLGGDNDETIPAGGKVLPIDRENQEASGYCVSNAVTADDPWEISNIELSQGDRLYWNIFSESHTQFVVNVSITTGANKTETIASTKTDDHEGWYDCTVKDTKVDFVIQGSSGSGRMKSMFSKKVLNIRTQIQIARANGSTVLPLASTGSKSSAVTSVVSEKQTSRDTAGRSYTSDDTLLHAQNSGQRVIRNKDGSKTDSSIYVELLSKVEELQTQAAELKCLLEDCTLKQTQLVFKYAIFVAFASIVVLLLPKTL